MARLAGDAGLSTALDSGPAGRPLCAEVACGGMYDKTAPENANQQSPYSFFENVTDALGMVCGTAAGKAAVQAKLKAVVVTH